MRIGLTGGIASGKTMVSRRLAELGAAVLDADGALRTDGIGQTFRGLAERLLAV